ncbi:MAG: TRAP transporter substrate-binding protein DctP [Deltaproteobacteria bacterium]|nr:TRAP transporter substrate-binding protein DctP [Deltaproteobacteria bacterium]MBW2017716.1 TRAP transporter substrate-binding protein DctP [Deltaproteobacteria bacterium]MBW2130310.1 TRAP transporter substrate-binding protein DctP [Deltaproteobacteria bacterium]
MAADKPIVMKFGLAAPDINPSFWATHYNFFKYEVERKSNGRLKVELIWGGALGSPADRMKQVMMGQIQGADTAEGPIAQVFKPVQVLSIPYLFNNVEQAWRVYDGPFIKKLNGAMSRKTGLKVLHWWESGGFKQWTNSRRPIRTPDDMKGLKMRVMPSPVFQKLVSSLGASPTPISFGELYGALKNKTVDGQNNALSLVNLFKYYQVQKYVTVDNHVYAVSSMIINDKFYRSLPKDLQKVIDNAQKTALAINRGVSRYTNHVAIEALKKHGMEINILTPEERDRFKARAQGAVLKWLRKEVGNDWVDGMLRAAEAAK